MKPATTSKRFFGNTKLLVIDENKIQHSTVGSLGSFLEKGDLIVFNRSATLPGSFRGILTRTQEAMEIRLAAFQGKGAKDFSNWAAIAFDNGSWRSLTENRSAPPRLQEGDIIQIGDDLAARVVEVDSIHNRLFHLVFESSDLFRKLYEFGKPIQYSYLKENLEVWDQQTIFSGPPISVEPPSAGFPINWEIFLELKQKGIEFATILHGAGIASSGDDGLDARLPLAEWFDVPQETVIKIQEAKKKARRVVALGTTVARALESAAQSGTLQAKSGLTTLKLGPEVPLNVVDALITGLHEPKSSHLKLVEGFCHAKQVQNGYREAEKRGYMIHEFGDVSLLFAGAVNS